MLPVAIVLLVFGAVVVASGPAPGRDNSLRARVVAAQEDAARAAAHARELADQWSRGRG